MSFLNAYFSTCPNPGLVVLINCDFVFVEELLLAQFNYKKSMIDFR